MKMKNMLLFLLLAGSFTIGFPQNKAPEVKTIVVKDSVQEEILKRLDSIYKLQNTIQEERKADLQSVQMNSKDSTEKRRSDISVMSDIAKNTEENFWISGLTFFALFTFFVSLGVSVFTSVMQFRTERHTKNVGSDRNWVCSTICLATSTATWCVRWPCSSDTGMPTIGIPLPALSALIRPKPM